MRYWLISLSLLGLVVGGVVLWRVSWPSDGNEHNTTTSGPAEISAPAPAPAPILPPDHDDDCMEP